jgi:hypothetical protein
MWIKFRYFCYWQLQINYSCSWWIHTHMDHSFWISILNFLQGFYPKENHNIYLCKSSIVSLRLEEMVRKIIWYNRPREFLLQKDYSNNDDFLHVFINQIPNWIIHDLCTCRWLYHQIINMKGAYNHLMMEIWIKPNTNRVHNLSISPQEYIFISLHVSIKCDKK